MAKCSKPALQCAYAAVMQVNFVCSKWYDGNPISAFDRCMEITDAAMKHLNSEHTKEVSEAVFNMKRMKPQVKK